MKRSTERLIHIKTACSQIVEFVDGLSFESYVENAMVMAAVERKILVIGEALRRYETYVEREGSTNKMAERLEPQVYMAIKSIGNFVRHEYDRIDGLTIWNVASMDVPILLANVDEVLAELEV